MPNNTSHCMFQTVGIVVIKLIVFKVRDFWRKSGLSCSRGCKLAAAHLPRSRSSAGTCPDSPRSPQWTCSAGRWPETRRPWLRAPVWTRWGSRTFGTRVPVQRIRWSPGSTSVVCEGVCVRARVYACVKRAVRWGWLRNTRRAFFLIYFRVRVVICSLQVENHQKHWNKDWSVWRVASVYMGKLQLKLGAGQITAQINY